MNPAVDLVGSTDFSSYVNCGCPVQLYVELRGVECCDADEAVGPYLTLFCRSASLTPLVHYFLVSNALQCARAYPMKRIQSARVVDTISPAPKLTTDVDTPRCDWRALRWKERGGWSAEPL